MLLWKIVYLCSFGSSLDVWCNEWVPRTVDKLGACVQASQSVGNCVVALEIKIAWPSLFDSPLASLRLMFDLVCWLLCSRDPTSLTLFRLIIGIKFYYVCLKAGKPCLTLFHFYSKTWNENLEWIRFPPRGGKWYPDIRIIRYLYSPKYKYGYPYPHPILLMW